MYQYTHLCNKLPQKHYVDYIHCSIYLNYSN
nr:MAG TPA: hypothetical protein [Caudoviricetes sp.]